MASALGNRIVKPTWNVAEPRMSYDTPAKHMPETLLDGVISAAFTLKMNELHGLCQ